MLQCSRRSAEQRLSQITPTLSAVAGPLSSPLRCRIRHRNQSFHPNFDYLLRNIRDSDTRKGGNDGTKQNTTVTEALVRIQKLPSIAQTSRAVPKVRIPFCLFYEYDSRCHNFVLFYTSDSCWPRRASPFIELTAPQSPLRHWRG